LITANILQHRRLAGSDARTREAFSPAIRLSHAALAVPQVHLPAKLPFPCRESARMCLTMQFRAISAVTRIVLVKHFFWQ